MLIRRVTLIPLLVASLAIVGAGSGCTTIVTPPAHPTQPVTVYLTDYGRHSSIVLPALHGDGYVEWAFGDWNYFALGHAKWWIGAGALIHSNQATLGRRAVSRAAMASDDALRTNLGARRVIRFDASSLRAEALELQLETTFRNSPPQPPLHSDYSGLEHVKIQTPYYLCHNCNNVTAEWLRRLGCDIDGLSMYSSFRLNPASQSATAQSRSKPAALKK